MLDRLAFVIGEALIALRRNGFMAFAAVTTVAVSLFLLGGMMYVIYIGEQELRTLPSQLDIRVFVKDGAAYPDIVKTAAAIRAVPGVATAVHIPRDKAWERYKRRYPPEITDGVENPLPDAFKVTVREIQQTTSVAEGIKALPNIAKVQYVPEVARFLSQVMRALTWIGSVLGGTLFVTSGILIFNAIRLTIYSRRRELRIMRLVGASPLTIRVPFVIEGILQGIAGGALASFFLFGAHSVAMGRRDDIPVLTGVVPGVFPLAEALVLLCAAGGLYGLVCSMIATSAPVKAE